MLLRVLLPFVLALLLTSCGTKVEYIPATEGIPELEYLVINFGNQIEDEERIFLLDSRAYYNENAFELVWMKFRTQRLIDICEARDLMVHVVEEFLEMVNTDSTLPFYVCNYPFTADNLLINIEFESFFGKYVDPLYIGRVRLDKGIVYYYAFNAIDPETLEWDQRVEPYEKAYRFSMFKHIHESPRVEQETNSIDS